MKVRFFRSYDWKVPWYVDPKVGKGYEVLCDIKGWNWMEDNDTVRNEAQLRQALTIIETLCNQSGEEE